MLAKAVHVVLTWLTLAAAATSIAVTRPILTTEVYKRAIYLSCSSEQETTLQAAAAAAQTYTAQAAAWAMHHFIYMD